MNQEQKALILKEIKTWRDSKLLPAEYCDFLANLYSEGDTVAGDWNASDAQRSQRTKRIGGKIQVILLVSGFLLLFLIFAFNFTLFPMPMQIGILLVGTFFFYILAWRMGRNNPLARVVWLAAAALFLAGDGYFYLQRTAQTNADGPLIAVMSIVFFLWVISGGLGRSRLIAGLGWAGVLLMFATYLEKGIVIGNSGYGVQHLYWLIPALCSLSLAYLLGRRQVYISPVFLLLGLIALFGPDLRMLFYSAGISFFIQAIVFLKLALVVSLLIVLRQNLRNWLATLRPNSDKRNEKRLAT